MTEAEQQTRPAPAPDRAPPRPLNFGTDRSAALPAPPPRPLQPVPSAPAAGPALPPTVAAEPATARRRGGTRRRAQPKPAGDGIAVYLGLTLITQLRELHRARPGTTYTSIALDAVEACAARPGGLAVLFDDLRQQQQRTGPLFRGRPARVTHHPDGRSQITLRPGEDDRATLDRLAQETDGCPNRSALIAAALEAYLSPSV